MHINRSIFVFVTDVIRCHPRDRYQIYLSYSFGPRDPLTPPGYTAGIRKYRCVYEEVPMNDHHAYRNLNISYVKLNVWFRWLKSEK